MGSRAVAFHTARTVFEVDEIATTTYPVTRENPLGRRMNRATRRTTRTRSVGRSFAVTRTLRVAPAAFDVAGRNVVARKFGHVTMRGVVCRGGGRGRRALVAVGVCEGVGVATTEVVGGRRRRRSARACLRIQL